MDRTAFAFDIIEKVKPVRKPDEASAILSAAVEQFGFDKACAVIGILKSRDNFAQSSEEMRGELSIAVHTKFDLSTLDQTLGALGLERPILPGHPVRAAA